MGKHGKTRFQDEWLSKPAFKLWLQRFPDDVYKASCSLCLDSIISVASMGSQALVNHMNGSKHVKKAKSVSKQHNLGNFMCTPSVALPSTSADVLPSISTALPSTTADVSSSISTSTLPSTSFAILPSTFTAADALPSTSAPHIKKSNEMFTMEKYISNDDATKAEIIWCMESVYTHSSVRKAARDIQIMKIMFQDSKIAAKLQLGRTKLMYVIVFGLAPYFKEELLKTIQDSNNFVLAFDESLNKVSQSQQMDIIVRFWNNEKNEVSSCYFQSVFLKKINCRSSFKCSFKQHNIT